MKRSLKRSATASRRAEEQLVSTVRRLLLARPEIGELGDFMRVMADLYGFCAGVMIANHANTERLAELLHDAYEGGVERCLAGFAADGVVPVEAPVVIRGGAVGGGDA